MKLISAEIEKAINFGTKASMIIDNVKNRPRKAGSSSLNNSSSKSARRKKEDSQSPRRGFKVGRSRMTDEEESEFRNDVIRPKNKR